MPRKKIPVEVIEAACRHNEFKPLALPESDRKSGLKGRSRIMYIENKASLAGGAARIGRVTFSKTGSTIYYLGQAFQSLKGRGFKANYCQRETGEQYWISGPKKNGEDRLYGERVGVEIDEDVREEYWTKIRNLPEMRNKNVT
jgi:hypothetical protein